MNKIWLTAVFFFFSACTSVDTQEGMSAYDYEDEEEEEFLSSSDDEEDNFDEELKSDGASATAQSEQLEEEAAEGELKEIEDEFAEFASEEEEYEEPSEEQAPSETLQAESSSEEDTVEEGETAETSEIVSDAGEEAGLEEQTSEEETAVEAGSEEEEFLAESETQEGVSGSVAVSNIRYENEQVYVDVEGGDPSYRSRFNEATRQFIIEIPNAVLKENLRWPYIMKEFQSGFALLQADQKSEDVVRIIIQMRPNSQAPIIASAETGGLVISSSGSGEDESLLTADQEDSLPEDQVLEEDSAVLEDTVAAEETGAVEGESFLQAATIYDFLLKEQKFYGKPITLDVRDANLKDILYFLAEDSGINMIISNQIKDTKVNIQLREVPWDQALFLIMKQNDLAYVREGNVVTIASIKDFESMQSRLNAIKRQQEASAPLKLEIVPIAYAQASRILSQINIFKTARGNIQADAQNNSLLIRDTESAIERMKQLIVDLDRTPKQVMISARIVEARDDFSRSFGISWLVPGEPVSLSPSIGTLGNIVITPAPLLSALPASPDTGTLGSNLSIGTFRGLGDLDVRLGFAETNGNARVLSSPRIMALNGQSASVNSNSESISFSAVIPEGGGGSQTQIQRSPLQLSLQVTPEITNVDSIYMQVNVNRSSEGQRLSDGASSASPVSTRSASTRILVKSGQTAVIGGIYETRESENLQGIPFLQKIPILSWLFSQKNRDKFRTELLLFLTPRIIDIGKESSSVAVHTK